MECLRLVLNKETVRYTCVQISSVWFASLRSEEAILRKSAQGHLLFVVVMKTLCTKFHLHVLYAGLRSEGVVTEKSAQGHVNSHHETLKYTFGAIFCYLLLIKLVTKI